MDLMEHAPNRAFWLKSVFDAEWQNIQNIMQSVDVKDLSFDIYQADEAIKIAYRVLARLQSNPTTRTLHYAVLATTAHIFGVMSARPITCRHASADHVDYVNVLFGATSAFTRLKIGSFLKIDP